jgi:hypothetical protein
MNGEITKERSVTPTLQSFASSKPKRAHPKSKEEAPNYNATTDDALARPAASASGCAGRAHIKSGQRIRFATSQLRTFFSIAI